MSNKVASGPKTDNQPVNPWEPGSAIVLGDREFDEIRTFIRELTGISMSDTKRQLICRRLLARLKATGINSVGDYLRLLQNGHPSEVEAFTNAMTTNLTSFFREQYHFEFLAGTIFPGLIARGPEAGRRLRIWSAGCSTGEEPYSIAITLRESLQELAHWDAKVLCTDIDSDVLSTGKAGLYSQQRVKGISSPALERWFSESRTQENSVFQANRQLQELLTFKQLNLMDQWPMKGKFDVIFCRNVIIYFDKPTQRILIDRFAEILEEGGYLILGHSESLLNVSDRFSLLGKTVYRKHS